MAQFFIGSHNDSKFRPTQETSGNQNHDGSLSPDDNTLQPVDCTLNETIILSIQNRLKFHSLYLR